MNFNSLFFPCPPKTYNYASLYRSIIYVPKNTLQSKGPNSSLSYIPCLYIPYYSKLQRSRS